MRKLIAIIALTLFGNFGVAIAQKLAHVNFQKLMLALPQRKAAEDSLQKEAARLQDVATKMKQKLDQKMAEYEAEANKPSPSKELLKILAEDIQDFQVRMQNFQNDAETILSNKETELLKPMYDMVKAAIKKVMKTHGYNYVLDENSFIEIDGGNDVTVLVAKELGITLPPDNAGTSGGTPQK